MGGTVHPLPLLVFICVRTTSPFILPRLYFLRELMFFFLFPIISCLYLFRLFRSLTVYLNRLSATSCNNKNSCGQQLDHNKVQIASCGVKNEVPKWQFSFRAGECIFILHREWNRPKQRPFVREIGTLLASENNFFYR
jgi:hypothetical protein